MCDSWERRIDRAADLAARDDGSGPLLGAYTRLLVLQRDCYASLATHAPSLSGSLERDLATVGACVQRILEDLAISGPPPLAEHARHLIDSGSAAVHSMLISGWRTPSTEQFFVKVMLQPYAELLAAHRRRPLDRDLSRADNGCPFCGGAPQVSILQPVSETDGGRSLQCGTCLTTWPFRRIVCVRCGEEDEPKLGYFRSPAYDHVRVDTCESCGHYMKSVDLTRLGLAVPIVDEVASAPLDWWARERGYEKIALNLIGL